MILGLQQWATFSRTEAKFCHKSWTLADRGWRSLSPTIEWVSNRKDLVAVWHAQTNNMSSNYVLRIRSSFLNSRNNALASRRRLSSVKYLILFFHHTPSASLRHKASKPSIEKLRHRFLLKSRKKQWYSLREKRNSASFHLTFTHGSVGLTPLKLTTNNSFSAMFPFSSKSSGWTVTSPVLSRGLAYSRRALNPW